MDKEIPMGVGYLKLLASVEKDEARGDGKRCREKLEWVIERVQHYAEVTGLLAAEILDTWEDKRDYWYMNYYQDAEQPRLDGAMVRIFDTPEAAGEAIGKDGFRCPRCGEVSRDPYQCNSGKEMEPGKICDWKVYGLFRDLGKGVFIFIKSAMRGERIFMPIAWEK